MEHLRRQDLNKLFYTVGELHTLQNLESFPQKVLSAIRNLIPSDAYFSYCITDQEFKTVNTLCDPAEATELVRRHDEGFDTLIHEHPLVAHYQKVCDQVVKLSDFYNRVRFHNTALYKEYYKKTGIEFQIAFSIPNSPYRTAFALNRTNRDFTERERLILICLRPWLIRLYHHLYEIAQFESKVALLQISTEAEGKGLILLSSDDKPNFFTPRAREWLKEYFPEDESCRRDLPEKLRKWIYRQRMSTKIKKTPWVVHERGKQLQISFFNGGTRGSLLQLTEGHRETLSHKAVGKSFGLSPRESDIIPWMIKGKTSAQIGEVLYLSHRTVEKHLQRIYAKLGVESRAGAVARVFEMSYDPKSNRIQSS